MHLSLPIIEKYIVYRDIYAVIFQVDTSRHIEWLKNVKHAHGSVEVTSLSQAEAINSLGIYCVGNIQQTALEQKCVRTMIIVKYSHEFSLGRVLAP